MACSECGEALVAHDMLPYLGGFAEQA
jgi:hypothetical protein